MHPEDPNGLRFITDLRRDWTALTSAFGASHDAAPSPTCPSGCDILYTNVCTFRPYRGHGYGLAAFDAVMTWARETGVRRADLLATEDGRHL